MEYDSIEECSLYKFYILKKNSHYIVDDNCNISEIGLTVALHKYSEQKLGCFRISFNFFTTLQHFEFGLSVGFSFHTHFDCFFLIRFCSFQKV